jgi:hypothetical protein
MKQYNVDYLNTKAALIDFLLIDIPCNIVEISYEVDSDRVDLLFILLSQQKSPVPIFNIETVLGKKVSITEEIILSEYFEDEKEHWKPTKYNRLANLLFSRAKLC